MSHRFHLEQTYFQMSGCLSKLEQTFIIPMCPATESAAANIFIAAPQTLPLKNQH